MGEFHKAAEVGDIKPGESKIVDIEGEIISIFNIEGEYFATSNTCPHKGGPLGEGILEGDVVTCPWHGWKFNVKTGVSPVLPSVKVSCFQIKVEGRDIMVEIN